MSVRVWQKCASVRGSLPLWHASKCTRKSDEQYCNLLLISQQHISSREQCTTHISRINTETTLRLFPLRQRLMWPRYYRPASGIARLLLPDGVRLQDVLDIYRIYRKNIIKNEYPASNLGTNAKTNEENQDNYCNSSIAARKNLTESNSNVEKGNDDDNDDEKEWVELHRDFAADKSLWMRCALADFISSFISKSSSTTSPSSSSSLPSLESSTTLHSSAPHTANSQEEQTHCIQSEEQEEEEKKLIMLRKFYKYTCRDRTMHDAEIRKLFQLSSYTPPPPPLLSDSTIKLSVPSNATNTTTISDNNMNSVENAEMTVKSSDDSKRKDDNTTTENESNVRHNNNVKMTFTPTEEEELELCKDNHAQYHFTSFAQGQQIAMQPIRHATTPDDHVQCLTFRELYNLLNCRYYSMSALSMLHEISGDEIIPSAELVQTLALYLKERLVALEQNEEKYYLERLLRKNEDVYTEYQLHSCKQSINEHSHQQQSSLERGNKNEHGDYKKSSKYKETNNINNEQHVGKHYMENGKLTFSRETPIVFFFTNGRLPYLINKTNILPCEVQTMERYYGESIYNNNSVTAGKHENVKTSASHNVQHPSLDVRTQRRLHLVKAVMRLVQSDQQASAVDFTNRLWSPTFFAQFKVEHHTVQEALMKYKPAIAVVEPHCSQDFLCDIRGFYSVREVVMLGPIDSPAMGSCSSPFLTFGTLPGADSYQMYNAWMKPVEIVDNLHRSHMNTTNQHKGQLPFNPINTRSSSSSNSTSTTSSLVLSCNQHLASSLPSLHSEMSSTMHMADNVITPPYAQQGYERQYIDTISSYLISPNDSTEVPNQYRCLSFRRIHRPVI